MQPDYALTRGEVEYATAPGRAAALSIVVSGAIAAVGIVVTGGEATDAAADPLGGTLAGVSLAAFILGAVGVLAVTGEYSGGNLGPWTGFAVFLGYAAVTVTGATLLFRHRDA